MAIDTTYAVFVILTINMIAYDLIGHTPLVLLESYSDNNVQIYAKLEQFNPGGSVKDRLGKYLIETALHEGRLNLGDAIVEATAGNTGIGLAIAANRFNIGADISRTPKAEGMLGAQYQARQYAAATGAVYMNQFESQDNPAAYKNTLGQEITHSLPQIDYFVAGIGSGGTFTGVASHLKPLNVKNILVEPEGSILNGGESHPHDIEGIGSEKWPVFLERNLVDDIITVSDVDGFNNVRQLAQREGLLVGSSSGAALQGALEIKQQLDKGVIVTIFPDGSDRYMSKQIFNYKGV